MTDPHKFYRELYEDSPLETATVERVNKTPIVVPTRLNGDTELQIPHYSCRVVTERGRSFENVPWQSPYVNPVTGAGIYVVPKKGVKVLLAYAKKGQPYIVGFLTPISLDGRYTGNREVVPDGSIVMRGDTGNKILVLDGGVITIQSTPICKRTYSPSLDQIRDFCRNYFLTTAGGIMTWTESTDGQRLTTLRFKAFEKAGGDKEGGESVEVRYGTHPEDGPNPGKIFSFVVSKGTTLTIDTKGNIQIDNKVQGGDNNITINNDGEFVLNNVKDVRVCSTTGNVEIKAGTAKLTLNNNGSVDIESPTEIVIKAPQVKIEADTLVDIMSPITRTDQTTQLAGGGLGVARLLDSVLVPTAHGPRIGTIISASGLTSSG